MEGGEMKIEEFFEIIPKLPGVRVYQFSDNYESAKRLADFAKAREFELQIVTFEEKLFEKLKSLEDEDIKVRYITENRDKYNLRSIMYDTVFVNLDIDSLNNIEEFLRKTYRIMKNAANIVLPVDVEKRDEIKTLLERCNYVAVNDTSLEEKRVVFIGKKLHGWSRV